MLWRESLPLLITPSFYSYSQQIHSVALRVANQDKPSYRDSLELPVPICRQNYSLVEQPVDILIKKLTKLSIIDKNINSWSKYQIWQKYQIWPKFQKLTKMSTVDKNVKFDKNIKFDQNINLTKMSNLRCTFSKMYLPLPHLLPFD